MDINDISSIERIEPVAEFSQVEVRFTRECGLLHYIVFNAEQKTEFISAVENPAYGGKPGDSAPYIAALGW